MNDVRHLYRMIGMPFTAAFFTACRRQVRDLDLRLFVLGAFLAPLAKLLEVELALHLFLVFDRIVVNALAVLALKTDEMFL
jgi:hypothetical protein